MHRVTFAAVVMFALGVFTATAQSAEIRLVSSVALKAAMDGLLPHFEQASAHKVTALYGTAADQKKSIDGGEQFDVAILTPEQIDDLIKNGKASSRVDLARTAAGFAIRAGALKPDISNNEKLKAFLLGVKSIGHGDPAAGGFSTVYFDKTAAGIGIADDLKSKWMPCGPGECAIPVAKGEAEIGIAVSSEVVPVPGVEFVALKPADPASYISFTAAIAANPKDIEATRALLAFLGSPSAKEAFKAKGLITP